MKNKDEIPFGFFEKEETLVTNGNVYSFPTGDVHAGRFSIEDIRDAMARLAEYSPAQRAVWAPLFRPPNGSGHQHIGFLSEF